MKKLLLILVFLNFTSLTFADSSEPFLKGVKDIVKLEFSYGRSYEGQVEECLISGKKAMCFKGLGIYTFQTGYRYKGEFNDNKPNGQGVFSSPDGQRYEGQFKDNNREGYGVMTYSDRGMYQEGSHYEGEWKNDKRDGQGIMTYLDDGRRLEGEFKDNVFIGGK